MSRLRPARGAFPAPSSRPRPPWPDEPGSGRDPALLDLEREVFLLVAELAAVGDLEPLSRVAVERFRELLGVRAVSLADLDRRHHQPRLLASTVADADCRPGATDPDPTSLLVLRRLRRCQRARTLADGASALGRCLAGLDADWVIPLLRRDDLVGLLVVGPKTGGGSCSQGELELLHLVSFQLAALLESATLLEAATWEGLTGALRRGTVLCLLEREVERMQRYRRPLAVLMLDLDHFKAVNDRYGHLVGDALLREVGRVLADRLRQSDLLGRYGGEEFLVVLPETDAAAARAVAEALRIAVASACVPAAGGARVRVTASIGGTVASGIEEDCAPGSEHLLTAADAALYQAKRAGRGRVVFLPAPARLVTGPARRRPDPAP